MLKDESWIELLNTWGKTYYIILAILQYWAEWNLEIQTGILNTDNYV